MVLGLRRREHPLRTTSRVGGQQRRTLAERGRGGKSAAALRPAGRALQLRRGVLVRPGGGVGPVPGAAVGIDRRIGGLGQGAVHLLFLPGRRRPVGGRAHQRVPEQHPGAELGQARVGRRPRRVGADPEPPGRPPDQCRIPGRLGRRQQQQPPRRVRQRLDAPPETLLDPPRQRHRAGQPEPASQLLRGQPAWQLQQRQRVAARLGDELIADPLVQRAGQRRAQQRPRIVVPQPPDHQLRQPRQITGRDPGREHQPDRLRPQPPRDERQNLRRGMIEPLLVIDQAHQRPGRSHLRQQAQHRQADQKPVRHRPRTHPERGPQRITLRHRQPPQPIQHRRAQLMQPGERQLHLRLDTRGGRHPAARRPPGQVLQQRRLARTRLAPHHQRPALTRPHSPQQPVQHLTFAAAAQQHRDPSSPRPVGSHLPRAPRQPDSPKTIP